MDTKSTGSKIFAVISLLLAPFLLMGGLFSAGNHIPQKVFQYYVLNQTPSYTETVWSAETYQNDWAARALFSLEEDILELEADTYSGYYLNHSSRMIYYAKNLKTGKVITNCTPVSFEGTGNDMTLDEFNQILYARDSEWVNCSLFNGTNFYPYSYYTDRDGDGAKITYIPRFVPEEWDEEFFGVPYKEISAEYEDMYEIAFAFKDSYAYNGILSQESRNFTDNEMERNLGYIVIGISSFLLGVLLLVLHTANRTGRNAVAAFSGKIMHWFPLEAKAILVITVTVIFSNDIGLLFQTEWPESYHASALTFLLFFFSVYLTVAEAAVYRSEYCRRSIIYWIYRKIKKKRKGDADSKAGFLPRTYRRVRKELRAIRKREREHFLSLPYQKRLHRTLIKYLLAVFGCILLGILLWQIIYIFAIPFAAGGIIGLTYWFYKRYIGILEDIERIAAQIRSLRSGNFDQKLFLDQNSQLLPIAADLNNLQDGLKNEIEKRMVSEKMKVELITNVSHDLKTPLTSMINYIDLLQAEELQPDYTNAYVKALDEKSKRLKLLIENIFDISKATSGNMAVNYEKLSMSELVNQTLAECEDSFERADLSFKKNFTDEKFYVYADGKMLWRVTENIINNAVKYSLKGTRIYLELTEGNEYVSFTVKNIAGYEMNFTADSIVERFVRGDESRTTEGTGLGLSIVKSFTEAMGGKVNVMIDGDLFKICVCIKKYKGRQ